MIGIGALIKQAPKSFLLCEDRAGRHLLRGSRFLASAGTMILDSPAFRTIRNVCCLYAPQSVAFWYSRLNKLRQHVYHTWVLIRKRIKAD